MKEGLVLVVLLPSVLVSLWLGEVADEFNSEWWFLHGAWRGGDEEIGENGFLFVFPLWLKGCV